MTRGRPPLYKEVGRGVWKLEANAFTSGAYISVPKKLAGKEVFIVHATKANKKAMKQWITYARNKAE